STELIVFQERIMTVSRRDSPTKVVSSMTLIVILLALLPHHPRGRYWLSRRKHFPSMELQIH
ncbi:MAG: hypothetical protein ACK58T_32900, partial [Phycisphaerae bacterium]